MLFLALIYVAFVSLGLPDSLLGSAWPIIAQDLALQSGGAGLVSMTISLGTITASLFSYKVIHRFGTGRVTFVSVLMTAIALLGFGLAPSIIWFFVSAIPLGLGAGAVDSGLNEFVAENFKASHMNWLHCFWGVGALLGPLIISALAKQGYSWRSGYFSVSAIQFLVVVLLFASLPMWKKMENKEAKKMQAGHANKEKASLIQAIKTPGAPWAMLNFFLYNILENSFMLWGASYLVQAKGLRAMDAAGWVSLFFVGITAGRFLAGIVALKIKSETLVRCGVLVAILGVALMIPPLPVQVTLASFVIVGLGLAPIFPGLLHQTPVYFGKQNAQAAMGLQMACSYTGITILPPIMGKLFEYLGFSIMPPILLASGVALLLSVFMLAKAAKKQH